MEGRGGPTVECVAWRDKKDAPTAKDWMGRTRGREEARWRQFKPRDDDDDTASLDLEAKAF